MQTASEVEDGDTPGNKVVYAVSSSFGNCLHCSMLFPERLQRTVKRPRVISTGTDSAVGSDMDIDPNLLDGPVGSSPGFVPEGVYRERDHTWYHVPNFGRKFFDALRKYYMIKEDGTEHRVVIKRPEKDSFCTWICIQGHPRNYSTGGKRTLSLFPPLSQHQLLLQHQHQQPGHLHQTTGSLGAAAAAAAAASAVASPPKEEGGGSRGRLVSVSTTATDLSPRPGPAGGLATPPPVKQQSPRVAETSRDPSENWVGEFGNFLVFEHHRCDESPMSRDLLRNKNACLKLNALADWFA